MPVPRISIVTPSYNQGEFLEACIDSVLSQNYPDLEYIIMDGGSTDNSVEIIKKYEKYLAYWQSKPDGGQYDAINEGFRRTTGEIMAWLNSDDKYHHHAFFKAAYLFTQRPDVEWITGRTAIWNRDGAIEYILTHFLPTFSRGQYLKKDYKAVFIQQEGTFWRRSLWDKAGGRLRTDLTYAGDLELWMRFFRHAPLHTVDALLGGYRRHGGQKTQYMDRYFDEAERLLDEEIEAFRREGDRHLVPAPGPIAIPHDELKTYINGVYAMCSQEIYTLSDDSGLVENYLLAHLASVEELLKALLVLLLRKWRLYPLYVRRQAFFSRVYHFFRKLFVFRNKGAM